MGWPQWVIVGLMGYAVLKAAALDGQPDSRRYSFSETCLSVGINAWLLWMGGFWS